MSFSTEHAERRESAGLEREPQWLTSERNNFSNEKVNRRYLTFSSRENLCVVP